MKIYYIRLLRLFGSITAGWYGHGLQIRSSEGGLNEAIIMSKTKYIAVVVIAALCIIFLFDKFRIFGFYFPREFNQAVCLKNPELRYKMTKRLIFKKVLINKSRSEVINLIGDEFKRTDSSMTNWTLSDNWYYLIEVRDCNPDPTLIYLKIDFSDNRVSSVSEVR